MKKGYTALARSRALQARQLKAAYSPWDDRPEHVLADLDAMLKTETFLADAKKSGEKTIAKTADKAATEADALLKKAR